MKRLDVWDGDYQRLFSCFIRCHTRCVRIRPKGPTEGVAFTMVRLYPRKVFRYQTRRRDLDSTEMLADSSDARIVSASC